MTDSRMDFFYLNALGIVTVLTGKEIIFIIDPEILVTVDRPEALCVIDCLGPGAGRNPQMKNGNKKKPPADHYAYIRVSLPARFPFLKIPPFCQA